MIGNIDEHIRSLQNIVNYKEQRPFPAQKNNRKKAYDQKFIDEARIGLHTRRYRCGRVEKQVVEHGESEGVGD